MTTDECGGRGPRHGVDHGGRRWHLHGTLLTGGIDQSGAAVPFREAGSPAAGAVPGGNSTPGPPRVDETPRDLWIDAGRLVEGPLADATTLARDAWIMPGLVDAHCHIGLDSHGGTSMDMARAQARTDRDAGTLLIRDAGSPIDTHELDHEPDLPDIIRAGRHIARPRRYLRNYGVEIEPGQLVDEVVRQARRGDGWVKLVGDWIDRDLGDLAPLWDPDEARRAIAAAHENGARVTAHCFGEQSVAELVDAGIDCIEHGTGMSPEVIDTMASRGVALVPTMINLENFPAIADSGERRFPVYAAHMRALYQRRLEVLHAAREAGVPIYAGTDAGGAIGHGRIGDEIVELSGIGGNDFALGAASWRARTWLGRCGPDIGQSADLVVFGEDPRRTVEITRNPSLVILRGVPRRGSASV